MIITQIIARLQSEKFSQPHSHPDCDSCQHGRAGFLLGLDKAIEVLREAALAE